jgi:phosphoribosyl 1,2-cyclic phosphodiesterase
VRDLEHSVPKPIAGSAAREGLAVQPSALMRARCWGTRGSVPTPGISTAGFGGNTSCLEITASSGRRFIFDAGSGIRLLGEHIARRAEWPRADLFLTHFHWDHIQGLPFFGPLYHPGTHLRIHGPKQGETDILTLIAGQMAPTYFPIPFEAVSAHLEFRHLEGDPWVSDEVEVTSMRVRHPGYTHGYKIRAGEACVAYFPDAELEGGHFPISPRQNREAMIRFLAGVDLLFHDGMYTDAEYARREGWGHSSFRQAVRLAEDAGVKRLYLFHHAPERSDDELSRILDELRADLARRGSPLYLGIAAEGEDLLVEGA